MIPKSLASIFLIVCFGCSSPEAPTQNNSQTNESAKPSINTKMDSALRRIGDEFDKGNPEKACRLHMSLSKDFSDYSTISPDLIRAFKQFELRCGNKLFSIDSL